MVFFFHDIETMKEETASNNDSYLLSRGTGPSVRLMAQHWLYKDYFGWNLHPTIQETWSSNKPIRFGDVATGNASVPLSSNHIFFAYTWRQSTAIGRTSFFPSRIGKLRFRYLFSHVSSCEDLTIRYVPNHLRSSSKTHTLLTR